MKLQDKVFIVTGGSSGIGKATAEALVNKGAKVVITGRNGQKAEKVAAQIGATAVAADVSKAEDVQQTVAQTIERHGKLDGLINNAGIGGAWQTIDELDLEGMRKIYDTNVFGAAMMGQEAARVFKKQNHGNIVNIASTAALKGFAKGSAYASSKFALRGMTQCWQAELRPHNVRVFEVNPSEVTTAFGQEDRSERNEENNKLRSEEIAHSIVSVLEMDDRGYVPEVTIHATNPF